jgi:hypothetical protein
MRADDASDAASNTLRARRWQSHQAEAQHAGRPLPVTPDLSGGMGTRPDALERTRKREQVLEMALRVFDAAGVIRRRVHRDADISSLSDLLVYSLNEWEQVAERKGGSRRLLNDKWAKACQAASPNGLFSSDTTRATDDKAYRCGIKVN